MMLERDSVCISCKPCFSNIFKLDETMAVISDIGPVALCLVANKFSFIHQSHLTILFLTSAPSLESISWLISSKSQVNISIGGWEGAEYAAITIAAGLTLLFLDSSACNNNVLLEGLGPLLGFPERCTLSTGGILVIISLILWTIAAAMNFWARTIVTEENQEIEALIMF